MAEVMIPQFNETVQYGNPENPYTIRPQSERLFAAGRETRFLPSMIRQWESAVVDWAAHINSRDKNRWDMQIDMPDDIDTMTTGLAATALKSFGAVVFRAEEVEATKRTVVNELYTFFPDGRFINQSQMNELLDTTVVGPVATLLYFKHAMSDIRSGDEQPGFRTT